MNYLVILYHYPMLKYRLNQQHILQQHICEIHYAITRYSGGHPRADSLAI